MKSFRVIERTRNGPPKPVIKDKTKSPQMWPNYVTTQHPGNPLEEIQYWFKYDGKTPDQGMTHTITPKDEIWRNGNVVLTVDRSTGQRNVQLNSKRSMFAFIAAPIAAAASSGMAFHEVHPNVIADSSSAQAASVWVGEVRDKFNNEEHIKRVWIDRATGLPLRLQFWSAAFPEIATEVLLEEYEFTDFNADFPDETFAFDVTDADLAPLGITKADLANLPANAFSVNLFGEDGAQVVGTVKDGNGVREVQGKLPFSFVHVPAGDVKLDFRMADGKKHSIGLVVNDACLSTDARRITGKVKDRGDSVWISGAD